jgi:hypothetical protein
LRMPSLSDSGRCVYFTARWVSIIFLSTMRSDDTLFHSRLAALAEDYVTSPSIAPASDNREKSRKTLSH